MKRGQSAPGNGTRPRPPHGSKSNGGTWAATGHGRSPGLRVIAWLSFPGCLPSGDRKIPNPWLASLHPIGATSCAGAICSELLQPCSPPTVAGAAPALGSELAHALHRCMHAAPKPHRLPFSSRRATHCRGIWEPLTKGIVGQRVPGIGHPSTHHRCNKRWQYPFFLAARRGPTI